MIIQRGLLAVIRSYQYIVSPWLGPACRFDPSCSQFALESITEHSVIKGLGYTLLRLMKCHPFHPGGFDPVRKQGHRTKESATL
ncbi:MAG: membrane protein insertion efficiency factor YidD [Nitrospira sp.]